MKQGPFNACTLFTVIALLSVAPGCFGDDEEAAPAPAAAPEQPAAEPAPAPTPAPAPAQPAAPAEDLGGATPTTKNINAAVLEELPFDNKADFENAKRGLLGQIEGGVINNEEGRPVWDLTKFEFLSGEAPPTANPSLWRQSQLTSMHGLYEVVDGIYQLRGYDLSNMTLIRGRTGWIVIDPLITKETAAAALALANEKLGERPVKAVIYTHSHVDHFGGVRGVVDEAAVKARKVKIIAPAEFTEHAVSENVLAGNTMGRRASYMYGNLVPKGPAGMIGTGLGQTTPAGTLGLMIPTVIISKTGQKMTLDGVQFVFQMAQDSEAPSEMMFYLPKLKAFCSAEVVSRTLHNLYTLRGAQVRDALLWSGYIDEAITLFGEAEVMFGSHHWPTWGNEAVIDDLKKQRDLYKYIHDQTLHLANQGYTMLEIAEMMKLPKSLSSHFANRGYYGSVNHNVKATYQRYFGWFDGNPANLHALPPVEAGKKYVEFMGGAVNVIKKARQSYANGEYRWVAMVMNHLVFAEPDNKEARELLAQAHEQMAFQAESGPWRNFYLTAAKELRDGVMQLPAPSTASPDVLAAMSLDLYLDYLAVRMNGPKAEGLTHVFNITFTDTKEKATLYLENSALNYKLGKHDKAADTTVTLARATLDEISLGKATFADKVDSGDIEIEGNQVAWQDFLATLETFEFWFNIVTP